MTGDRGPEVNGRQGPEVKSKAKSVTRSPVVSLGKSLPTEGKDDLNSGPLHHQGRGLLDNAPAADSVVPPRKNLSSLEVAQALMEGNNEQPQAYVPDDAMCRISLKVANCTPDQLSADMFCRLRSLLLTADASVVQVRRLFVCLYYRI